MTLTYENNLSIGNNLFICIRAEEGKQPVCQTNGIADANQTAAINAIVQTIRCLSLGRLIDQTFNPTITDEDRSQMVKCRWLRSGRLQEIGPTDKKYQHADSVDQALTRLRIFTCSRSVLNQTPKRRQGKLKGT